MSAFDEVGKKRPSRVGSRSTCGSEVSSKNNKDEDEESFTDESLKDIYGRGIKSAMKKDKDALEASKFVKKSSLSSFKKPVSSKSIKDFVKNNDTGEDQ